MRHKKLAETQKIVMGRRYKIDTSAKIAEYRVPNTVEIYKTPRGKYFIRVLGRAITPLRVVEAEGVMILVEQDRYYPLENEEAKKILLAALERGHGLRRPLGKGVGGNQE